MKFDIDAQTRSATRVLPDAPATTAARPPDRIAWLVIWGAFSVCLLLTVSLPLGARHLLLYSVEARTSMLQAISPNAGGCSTVSFTPPNATQPTAVNCTPASFPEGSVIETDQNSRGLITFFDGSVAQVFPSSRLVAAEMRQPRYHWSELPNTLSVRQDRGLIIYAAATAVAHPGNPDGRPVHLQVHTKDFDVTLPEGSYSIEVTDKGSQIIVTWGGPAMVHSSDGTHAAAVAQGQRLQVTAGQAFADPLPAAQDLIVEGSFMSDDVTSKWTPFFIPGSDGSPVAGAVDVKTVENRRALHILRSGAGTQSANTGVRQNINRDVSYFHSIILSADVRLHQQTLSGGGYLSTEYPLIIRLRYRDANGNEAEFVHGFYYQNDDENPTRNGQPIPRDIWVPYQTSNLLTGPDPNPKPFYLLFIEVYASGWDYESYISGIHLTVE